MRQLFGCWARATGPSGVCPCPEAGFRMATWRLPLAIISNSWTYPSSKGAADRARVEPSLPTPNKASFLELWNRRLAAIRVAVVFLTLLKIDAISSDRSSQKRTAAPAAHPFQGHAATL